jgi:hypothetical protein
MAEAEYCHRLALMNRGKLVALDTPRALREGLVVPILAFGTSDAPLAVEALRGLPGVGDVTMFGRTVHAVVDDEAAAREAIPARLATVGLQVEDARTSPPRTLCGVRAAGVAAVDDQHDPFSPWPAESIQPAATPEPAAAFAAAFPVPVFGRDLARHQAYPFAVLTG